MGPKGSRAHSDEEFIEVATSGHAARSDEDDRPLPGPLGRGVRDPGAL